MARTKRDHSQMEIKMAEMRTVELCFNAVELTELKQKTEAEKAVEAIGYLSQWNFTFPSVEIRISSDREELIASYYDAVGKCSYVIGAVWHSDHFGFHS